MYETPEKHKALSLRSGLTHRLYRINAELHSAATLETEESSSAAI